MKEPHLLVIDPAVKRPEIEAFNWIALRSPFPTTYHLPALQGMASLSREVGGVKGIVIMGSLSSVNERHPWQIELERWLRPWLDKGVPTLGICYGHQMLASMFGGRVSYARPDRKKHLGFREIHFSPDPLWGGVSIKGKICVSHEEMVTEAPPEMEVVGRSPEVPIDALRHRNLPIWSFQAHPEAALDFLSQRGIRTPVAEAELTFGYQLIDSFLKRTQGDKP